MGQSKADWHADVPVWGGVRLRDLYPGIDLVVGGQQAGLRGAMLPWRLEVKDDADLSAVRLRVEGAGGVALTGDRLWLQSSARRALRLRTAIGQIELPLPHLVMAGSHTLQEPNDDTRASGVVAVGPTTFDVLSPYQAPAARLAPISPRGTSDLAYSTFLGGSDWDIGYGIAVDGDGNAYVTGRTPSGDFPVTPGAFDETVSGIDVFAVKVNPDGSDLAYATFIGGLGTDTGAAIAVESGKAYISGDTWSPDFPLGGGSLVGENDVFVVSLNDTGTDLDYTILVGGSDQDAAYGIAVEGGSAYAAGGTLSNDFPASGYAGKGDAFVIKVDTGGGLSYATLLGGGAEDAGFGIAVKAGQAYVTGQSWSVNFPGGGYHGNGDAFWALFDSSGARLGASLLGGLGEDRGNDIAVDSTGLSYLTGATTSDDFPVSAGAYGGSGDAFMAQLDSVGAIVTAYYLGGSAADEGRAISLDVVGGIQLGGVTASSDLPVTGDPYQPAPGGGDDAFAARIDLGNPYPDHLTYATYLGGIDNDRCYGLAVDAFTYAYLTGYTKSSDFPTTPGAFSGTLNGERDAFVAKLATGPLPAINLEKRTNGLDADQPPGPFITAGSNVSWTYVVTNTGDLDLSAVTVVDDQGLTVDCPQDTLAVNETITCTAAGTAQVGQYANVGTASGDPDNGLGPAIDTDASHYFGAAPGIDLEKQTNGQDADSPTGPIILAGEPVTWTYVVTNTGNTGLSSVGVSDDLGGPVPCPDDALAVRQSMTCIVTGTAVSGQYENLGTVIATPPVGADVSDSDPSHYYGAEPNLVIQKLTEGEDADTAPGPNVLVGETVKWTYVVTNSGNVTLTNVSVTDNGDVAIFCPQTELAAKAFMVCNASDVAVAGQYTNTGTVSASPPVGPGLVAHDISHYFGVDPHIAVQKLTHGQDADTPPGPYIEVGDNVSWTYVVTNTGNAPLTQVAVTDDQGLEVSCPGTILDVDEEMTCTASSPAIAGQYANLGTASGNPPLGPNVEANDPSHYYGSRPGIALEKRTNGLDADTAPGPYLLVGQPVTWTYIVTNTSNVTLTNITVVDDQSVTTSCPADTLGADEVMVCTASGVATAGQYSNMGQVTGLPPVGSTVGATDPSHYYGSNPQVKIEKLTNGQDADTLPGPTILAGTPVTWTYLVTNTGNVQLSNIVVGDDQGLAVDCPSTELTVTASMVCTATGVVQVGTYTNTGTATGTPPGELAPVFDSDLSHYFGASPSVDLQKQTNGQDADTIPGPYLLVGDPVTWTYGVTNTGNITLAQITLSDDQAVPVFCPLVSLVPSATMVCTGTGIAEIGQYTNTGILTASLPAGLPGLNAHDRSHYYGASPAIALEVWTNGQDADTAPGPYILAGEPLTWTYVVSNSGNVSLEGISLVDDEGAVVNCPQTSLEPNEVMTCTAQGIAVVGQYTNTGTVTGTPPVGPVVVSSDPSHYFGARLSLTLKKWTNNLAVNSPPGPYLVVGEPVTWTYSVTNGSNVPLTGVALADTEIGAIPCPTSTLAVSATMACTATGTVTAGQYSNTGIVSGTPPASLPWVGASDTNYYYGSDPGIALQKLTNGQDADGPPGIYVGVGQAVTWTYLVSNTGNVPLTGVVVADTQGLVVQCPESELAVSGSMVCTATGVADLGQYANTGIVTGTPPVGADVTAQDPSHYFGIQPSLALAKSTNGHDADEAPGPVLYVGDPLTWTYRVTNTGNITLTGLAIVDDPEGSVPCPTTTLAPGLSMVCTATAVVEDGPYANVGQVSGEAPVGPVVAASDPSHYFGFVLEPFISLQKFTNDRNADQPPGPYIETGDAVVWRYVVANSGNITLTNITVTDTQLGLISCPSTTLSVREVVECTASGVATPGQYDNLGVAVGYATEGSEQRVSSSDPSHYYGSAPAITLEKHTNGHDADQPPGPYLLVGQPLTWTYLVTNTGNVTLTEVSVTDDQVVTVACPDTTLAPSATMICSATAIAQAGQYANTGQAMGLPPVGSPLTASDASHYFGSDPAISLEKQTNGQDADQPPGPYLLVGQQVTWTYLVANEGNLALSSIVVTDSQGLAITCPDTTLPVSASMVCSATGTVEAGPYANRGQVSATPPDGLEETSAADDSHYFGAAPAISLEKHTNGADADQPPGPYLLIGQPLTWTYLVTNAGNVTLTDVAVTDDQGVTVTCPDVTLVPSATMVCTATGVAQAGQYANTGQVMGLPPVGDSLIASDPSHYFGSDLIISLEKQTNGQDADQPPGPYLLVGQPLTWTYLVANEGNLALSSIVVTDSQGLAVACPDTTLPVSASMVCSATGTVEAGPYANRGRVRATLSGGLEGTSATDDSHYFGTAPAISLEKLTNGHDADQPPGPYLLIGQPLTWTYLVTNTGNVTLTEVLVSDDQGVAVACPDVTLAPSATMVCSATGVVQAGQYANTGQAIGLPPVGDPLIASDPSHYFGSAPAISLEKQTNGHDADQPPGPYLLVGQPLTWTYLVANEGNLALSSILVTDSQGLAVTCPDTALPVSASMVCSATGTVEAGPYANRGQVRATPPGGLEETSAADDSHYFGAAPAISLEKHTNGADADQPPGLKLLVGEPVTWTYLVANTGNVALTDIVVVDDRGASVTCPAVALDIGQGMVCTATALADPGPYENLGTVTAIYGEVLISDSDVSHYYGVEPLTYVYLPLVMRHAPSH
ncbi:MAG: SBBP repeat-containing protein [Anaerolineae bacterium]